MINGKKVLAVVLARAGSKGIPMKNVRDLLGKPLFLWSVEAGLQSKYVDKTVISSNCKNVFKEYENFYMNGGVETREIFNSGRISFIDRPDEISGDLSKNEDAVIHTLQTLKENYDVVIQLQPTSPARINNLLDRCIEAYEEGNYDSLLTATKDTPFLWRKEDGKWKYPVDKNHCCNRKMRQEFDEDEFVYHDCGNIYIVDKFVLMTTQCRIGDKPCVFEIKGINSLQIDEEFDFELIEQMAKVKGLTTLI